MKKAFITTLLLALCSFPALQAGEAYCAPECKAPIGCCANTGYIFAYGGISYLDEHYFSGPAYSYAGEYDFGNDFIFGAGVGLHSDFLCGSRFEIEGLWQNRYNPPTNTVTVPPPAPAPNPDNFGSDISVQAIMLNVLKEINLGCITAYGGLGIGLATVDYSSFADGDTFSDEDTVLAYQLILGAERPVSDCLALFAQYKLLGVTEQEFSGGAGLYQGDAFITHNLVFGAKVGF
jgi:opacity protein-like surface antigen